MLLPGAAADAGAGVGVTELGAAAGVMVTASHNPPADNGYKVYLGDGAQIVPPHDAGIAERIDAVDPTTVPLAADDDPLIERARRRRSSTATSTRCAAVRLRPDVRRRAGRLHADARRRRRDRCCGRSRRAGLPEPFVVAEQAAARPGRSRRCRSRTRRSRARWTSLIALAASDGALLALANDPDADRLGAAIPQPDGVVAAPRRRRDRLAARRPHPRAHTDGDDRLVVTTLVSSSLLGRRWRPTTACTSPRRSPGSSGSAATALDRPDLRFVFGYEQALGYLVAPRPLDKDGISAAVVLAEVAARRRRRGHDAAGPPRRHRRALRPPRRRRAVGARCRPGRRRGRGRARCRPTRRPSSLGVARRRRAVVPRGRPAAARARGRRPRPGPPERHRAEGQALRRGRRRRPGARTSERPLPAARGCPSEPARRSIAGCGRRATPAGRTGGRRRRRGRGRCRPSSFRWSSMAAVTTWTERPASRRRSMPSGAHSAHTTVIGSGCVALDQQLARCGRASRRSPASGRRRSPGARRATRAAC